MIWGYHYFWKHPYTCMYAFVHVCMYECRCLRMYTVCKCRLSTMCFCRYADMQECGTGGPLVCDMWVWSCMHLWRYDTMCQCHDSVIPWSMEDAWFLSIMRKLFQISEAFLKIPVHNVPLLTEFLKGLQKLLIWHNLTSFLEIYWNLATQ